MRVGHLHTVAGPEVGGETRGRGRYTLHTSFGALCILTAMQANSERKSRLVYDTINQSQGFYSLVVEPKYRSRVNVPFRAGYAEREKVEEEFLKLAEERGLVQLKGHRSVGGLRASLYNALSVSEVEKLVVFMQEFMQMQRQEE